MILALLLVAGAVSAQDLRTVTEPVIPSACMTLERPSTGAIQKAIDSCARGQGVMLRGAFVMGPVRLKTGVTLIVDRGAVISASLNAREYDITPGSCGVVNKVGHGCRALITVENASGSGVMGDGVIDGRGGEKIEGQKDSSLVGSGAGSEGQESESERAEDHSDVALGQLHAVSDHAEELAELSCVVHARDGIHGLGREDRFAEDFTEHGWHRSFERFERDHYEFVHPRGR